MFTVHLYLHTIVISHNYTILVHSLFYSKQFCFYISVYPNQSWDSLLRHKLHSNPADWRDNDDFWNKTFHEIEKQVKATF